MSSLRVLLLAVPVMSKKRAKAPSPKRGKAATTNKSSATKAPASSSHSHKSKKDPPTLASKDESSLESEVESSAKRPRKSTGPGQITWSDLSRTDRLLNWLDQNAEDWQKLFSDSSQDARKEQRRRRVAPGSKAVYHLQIATAVFSVDAKSDIREEFKVDSDKYAKPVENHLGVSVPSVTPSYIHHSLILCIHQAKDQVP